MSKRPSRSKQVKSSDGRARKEERKIVYVTCVLCTIVYRIVHCTSSRYVDTGLPYNYNASQSVYRIIILHHNRSTTALRSVAQFASLLKIMPGSFILSALVSPILHIAIGY